MDTLMEVAQDAASRLEEPSNSPIFWDQQREIFPAIVAACNEAVLMTGDPEKRATSSMTLAKGQQFYDNPAEAVVVLRLEGPGGNPIRRVTLAELDLMKPDWQKETGAAIKYWFPFGMTRFGVYPRLTVDIQVVPTYVALPVPVSRPFTGNEELPFQGEYVQALRSAAVCFLRAKEGGAEFQEGLPLYDDYLQAMQAASEFSLHKGNLRFTRRGGIPAKMTEKAL